MITNYHRPVKVEEAVSLLQRVDVVSKPIAGGYYVNRDPKDEEFEVVDIQALGLNVIEMKGKTVGVGANVRLNQLVETKALPQSLYIALNHEANLNLRNQITLPGLIRSADGRSSLLTWLLGTDAAIVYADGAENSIGDYLAIRRKYRKLISSIQFSLEISSCYMQVARTPADLPIVCMQLTRWNSGRVRAVVGGFGNYPRLAYDGHGAEGVVDAVRNTCHDSTDEWASAEYRMSVAETLVQRCIEEMEE